MQTSDPHDQANAAVSPIAGARQNQLLWDWDSAATSGVHVLKQPQAIAPEHVLQFHGSCTMAQIPALLIELKGLQAKPEQIDLSKLERVDSAGALFLLRLLARPGQYLQALKSLRNASPEQHSMLQLVAERATEAPATSLAAPSWRALLEAWGRHTLGLVKQVSELANFFGAINHCFWLIVRGQRKLRLTSVVHHIERTGLNAVPIVSLLCFLVGAVVAFLSATALRDFGASLLTIEIVSVSFLREFGVLLTAILVAGRSGSAFTAEIGSMRSREEIDAIRALSLDPIELLVIPRLLALLFTLPMLSFIATLSGIAGGALVGAMSLDISPTLFLSRMQEKTELYYLWLGLIKAPVFAFLIAAIGCLEGLKVSGSAESVGTHTTASVVQSIFMVIVFDSLFAVLYMQLDL